MKYANCSRLAWGPGDSRHGLGSTRLSSMPYGVGGDGRVSRSPLRAVSQLVHGERERGDIPACGLTSRDIDVATSAGVMVHLDDLIHHVPVERRGAGGSGGHVDMDAGAVIAVGGGSGQWRFLLTGLGGQ